MKMRHRRKAEAGVTLLDASAAGFVVAVSLVGMVTTVIYQRNLVDQTVRLWQAAGDATAALEDLRAESRTGWRSLTDTWEGHEVETRTRAASASTDMYFGDTVVVDDQMIAVLETEGATKTPLEFLTAMNIPAGDLTNDDFVPVEGETISTELAQLREKYNTYSTLHGTAGVSTEMHRRLLRVRVSADDTDLVDADGMWAEGATEANFYHVDIEPVDSQHEFGRTLKFETYVADRTSLDNSDDVFDDGTTEEVVAPTVFNNDAERVNPDPTNVAITGTSGDLMTWSLENWSSDNLSVKKLRVEFRDGGKFVSMSLNGTQLFNGGATGSKEVTVPAGFGGIAPGTFDVVAVGVSQHDEPPVTGQRVKVTIEFVDGSKWIKELSL